MGARGSGGRLLLPYFLSSSSGSEYVQSHDPAGVLLGEADVDPQHYPQFLNDGKLTALFNFYVNNYTFLAFAREQAAPLEQALRELPVNHEEYYLTFLRNHDELDLGMLKDEEREEVFQAFAPSESMRIYDRGIRRRMPPMFENDPNRTRMAMSLLFSLPGTPVLRYGAIISYSYQHQGAWLVVGINLAGRKVDFDLASPLPEGAVLSVVATPEKTVATLQKDRIKVTLPRYGYIWMMIERRDA